MKKILFIATLCLAMALGVAGCGDDDKQMQTNNSGAEAKDDKKETKSSNDDASSESNASKDGDTLKDSDTSKDSDTPDIDAPEESSATLADMEAYLLEKGVISGEKSEVLAEMIGAVAGFKYLDSGVEIYEYDVNSEAYQTITSGGSLEIEGMDGYSITATAVHGKFVLIMTGETENQQAVDAFNEFTFFSVSPSGKIGS